MVLEERPWRSPDHPPYALMISEAIKWLSDPSGVTASEISAYIISHFDGLPPAHDKLFPFFLRKFTNVDFVEIFPGRFGMANPASEEPHLIEISPKRKRLSGILKPRVERNHGSGQKVARRRGRPRKNDRKEIHSTSLSISSLQREPLTLEIVLPSTDEKKLTEPKPAARRRGRPPKKKLSNSGCNDISSPAEMTGQDLFPHTSGNSVF